MKKSRILAIVLALLVLFTVAGGLVVTAENEYTLVLRFGKIDRIESNAGLTLKIPFIETSDKLPRRLLIYDLKASDVITKDKKTMIVDSYVLWKITDPQVFARTLNRSVTAAESRIDAAVFNATKNAISSLTQSEVIAARDGELTADIMRLIGNSMDSYGIEILSVEIKQLDLPDDNKEAVYERMISERNQIAASYQAEGDSEAKIIRNATDKEIQIMLSDANAKAAEIIAEGEGEYMRILAEAYNTEDRKDFYSFVRALDAARKSLTNGNKTLILPKDSPLAEIFSQISAGEELSVSD